jgi:signal transduction histidine kinase
MFDARQLRRWRVDEARLPPGSVIRFREPSIWDRYRWQIAAGAGLVVVQSLLIAGLFTHRVQRRRVERALAERLRFERLLSDLSATFVAVPAGELAGEIGRGLARLGEELGLDRATLAELGPAGATMVHSWVRSGVAPLPHAVEPPAFPWAVARVMQGHVVRVPRVEDLPDEAAVDRASLAALGTVSLLVVPLSLDGKVVRALSLAATRARRDWPDDLVQRLRIAGEVLNNAVTRHASDEALRTSHARIRDLAGQLITAQEEERRRISRELHDDLNQKIAVLALAISRLRRSPPADAGRLQQELEQLHDRTIALADRSRRVSHELHPALLEHAGLVAALRAWCAEFRDGAAIEVDLDLPPSLEDVPAALALGLYRVAQEALRNVERHAGCRRAAIAVRVGDGVVELTVRDDGRGFDPAARRGGRGLGLVSMDERLRLLGGTLEIRSKPGKGTQVIARAPLQMAPAATSAAISSSP